MRANKAILACAKWLAYCLSIGWSRDQLDDLEALWWKHHDKRGNLLQPKRTKRKGETK